MPGGQAIDPDRLPSPAEIAGEKRLYSEFPQESNNQKAAIRQPTWLEQILQGRPTGDVDGDNATGENERLKVRSLPDDQREEDKGRGR